jgi:hypothetical protein
MQKGVKKFVLSHKAAVLFALFSLSLFSLPASTAEEIRLATAGPLNDSVLSFTLPAGYAIKEVERRYDKYWSIDVTGPPTVVTSKTQRYQNPQTYESVPDTMTISIRIGTISMSQPNMTVIAHYDKLAITDVYEEGDTQINGRDAHYVLASHTSEPTGYFTSFLQSGSIAVHLGAAWYVTLGSNFLGDRLDVETEDFVMKVKVGDTPIIEKHQQNLMEVLQSVRLTGHPMGVSLEPPETPEGWELVGHYYDVNDVEIEYWGLGMATAPGKDPPDLLHIPRITYVKWNGMSSDEFVKWVYRPIDPQAAQLQVSGESPFYIAMTDAQNRTTGWLAQENHVVNEIPGAVCVGINQTWDHPYEEEPTQEIRILQPPDHYVIDLIGTGEGRYRVTIKGLIGSNITSTDRITGTIAKDVMIKKDVYTTTSNGDLIVSFPELTPLATILCCLVIAMMMGHGHRSAPVNN